MSAQTERCFFFGFFFNSNVLGLGVLYCMKSTKSHVTVMEPPYSPCRGEESKLKEESSRWDPFLVKSSDSNGFWPCEQKGRRSGVLSKSRNDKSPSQPSLSPAVPNIN